MNLLTKKIPTLVGLILLVAGIVGIAYYFESTATKTTPETTPDKIKITNVSDNKFTVSWTTKSPTIGSIEYGMVGNKLTNIAKDERDIAQQDLYLTHHVTLEGLQPATQYAFRILTGTKPVRFDNNGSPYTVSTGPVIGATPVSQSFYGNVVLPSNQPANGSIVYMTLPGGAPVSTLVRESGNYAFTLSTIRNSDLRNYVQYDPAATIASLSVESGSQQSVSAVSLANSAPVPTITLGQSVDFLNQQQVPDVAQVQPEEQISNTEEPITPSIFNVEPLAAEPEIDVVGTTSLTILNPKDVGETLRTLRPEFRGTGPAGAILSIALTGQKAISDTVAVGTDGTWSWAPVIDLKTGKQTITVSYLANGGTTQKLAREFNVSTSTTGMDPAFVSSPSASTKTPSVSATPRTTMPDTTDGTPVTGVIENTLLTAGLGLFVLMLGVALLVL